MMLNGRKMSGIRVGSGRGRYDECFEQTYIFVASLYVPLQSHDSNPVRVNCLAKVLRKFSEGKPEDIVRSTMYFSATTCLKDRSETLI